MLTKCYICNKKTFICQTNNIFTSKTIGSRTLIYKLLENFIGHEIVGNTKNLSACEGCFSKLNEYDEALCTIQRVQNELTEIFNSRGSNIVTTEQAAQGFEITEVKNIEEVPVSDEDVNDEVKNEFELVSLEEDGVTFVIEANSKSITREDESSEQDDYEIELFEEENIKNEEYVEYREDSIEVTESGVNEIKNKKLKKIMDTNNALKKEKICKRCDKYFANIKELNEHKKKEHKSKERHVCDICGISYKVQSALKVHIGMHNGENPFKCEVCGKTFTQKGALKRHRPIHTGERPYQCDKCGKQFIHYSSFHMHNLAHNNIRNKKCEVCGLLLRSSSHLNRHMLVHTGQKPHACPKCGQRFAQRYNMMSHLRSHHQGIHREKKRPYSTFKDLIIEDSRKFETVTEKPKEYEVLIRYENEYM